MKKNFNTNKVMHEIEQNEHDISYKFWNFDRKLGFHRLLWKVRKDYQNMTSYGNQILYFL